MEDIGTDVIERIRFYRFSSLSSMLVILLPLAFGVTLSLVMLITAIVQERCWLFETISDLNTAVAILATVGALLLFAGIAAAKVRSKVRQNLKDFYREKDYDPSEYESFKSALEGVSMGLGMSPPELEVLGIPAINSIAFRDKGEPRVGVTSEAMKAGLSRSEKEAMMAHEIAHIALGDYFLASSSAGFEYAGYGLGMLFILMAILLAVAVNIYLLLFLLPLCAPLIVVLVEGRLRKRKKLIYRHNDLLADTIVAKLISDPGALRETIEKLWDLSEETRAMIPKTAHFQGYLFVWRPLEAGPIKTVTYDGKESAKTSGGKTDTTKIYWVPSKTGVKSRTAVAFDAVRSRITNLKSIEQGNWIELERPDPHERMRSVAELMLTVLIIIAVVVTIFVPWGGKTAWGHATTNVVWESE